MHQSLISAMLGIIALSGATAGATPALEQQEKRLEQMQRDQERLYRQVQEKLESIEDGSRKDELKRLLAEIERRMREEGLGRIYLSPRSNLTPDMREFHERLVRKIEDCGTRHLPKRDGKTIHGKGIVGITLDRGGRVLEAEVLESSRDETIDKHIQRVIRTSSPFGSLPTKITPDRTAPFKSVMIATHFEFKHDDSPDPSLPESERCKWKEPS